MKTKLDPCPKSPNCVCSFDTPKSDSHYIKPIRLRRKTQGLAHLYEFLEARKDCTVLAKKSNYIKAVFVTPLLRFKDDVEFLLAENGRTLHVRSASRVGHSDLGTNRRRIESMRSAIEKL
ncbi:DUF1499 domain-containing protein [bacterium]|nr:DUF1499 domain-containing protein [bacterium]